jgi:hypothetical protein
MVYPVRVGLVRIQLLKISSLWIRFMLTFPDPAPEIDWVRISLWVTYIVRKANCG